MTLMWRLLGAAQHDQPTLAAAVFDAPGKTFRQDLFPAYKSNRPARDIELAAQLPYMRHAAEAMGLTPVEVPFYEADDVIATLAWRAKAEGIRTTIVSSDKDYQQLLASNLIEIVDPVAHRRLTADDVRKGLFGVHPSLVPDVQALAGDAVDNIPGLEGVGLKTAAFLIQRFDSIEGCVRAVSDPEKRHFIPPRHRVTLKHPRTIDRLRLYRELAILRKDAPVAVELSELRLEPIQREHVMTLLKTLEAHERFDAIFATEPKMQRLVEPIPVTEQLDWWTEELQVKGQKVPDVPQCGYYERRLVRGGVYVPACIWRIDELDPVTNRPTGMQILQCQLGDAAADPVQEWAALSRHPITAEKYLFEIADRRWAFAHAPGDPKANPRKPVDFSSVPPPKFPQLDSQKRKPK